jgi:hypothetical protein
VSFLLRSDNEHASYICNSSGCQLVHVHAFWSVYFTCGFLFCEMIFGRHQLIAEACGSSVYWGTVLQAGRLTNPVALVRERTIPTERPPLVGEVSANFCG